MQDGSLKQRIEELLAKCGFRSSGLFVMDGSRRSTHGNAYFTGFGKTKRIVFFDTLISRLNENEIEAVLAHELGSLQAASRDPAHGLDLRGEPGVPVAARACSRTRPGSIRAWAWPIPASNAMALLLFVLVVPVFTFLLQPLVAMYSRKHEFEADAYAARYSSARELVSALVKLYKDNASTLTPDPLHSAFYDSHPPASVRIAQAAVAGCALTIAKRISMIAVSAVRIDAQFDVRRYFRALTLFAVLLSPGDGRWLRRIKTTRRAGGRGPECRQAANAVPAHRLRHPRRACCAGVPTPTATACRRTAMCSTKKSSTADCCTLSRSRTPIRWAATRHLSSRSTGRSCACIPRLWRASTR